MSVQFGRWNFDNVPVDDGYLRNVSALLRPYTHDGNLSSWAHNGCALLSGALRSTAYSDQLGPQSGSDNEVMTWDGRLDNRADLIRELDGLVKPDSGDEDVLGAAIGRWGTRILGRLVGDWALAVWNPSAKVLFLAKDFLGARHLYYLRDERHVSWCTVLDPLVLLEGKVLRLEEEYVAGWFSQFPAAHLTPYAGLHGVPPGCFVTFQADKQFVREHWNFDPEKRIRYKSDEEYEEHFRSVLSGAVRRRLRSHFPVLAELSGGVDSTSIVCVADQLLRAGAAETPGLDTVSYFDDSQPAWNERPYFQSVEQKRGRSGCHIDVSSTNALDFAFDDHRLAATPGHAFLGKGPRDRLRDCLKRNGNRMLLSGIGGDEVAGGVPTPTPELANLLAEKHLLQFARQLKLWALNKRKPWYYLLAETISDFLPGTMLPSQRKTLDALWLSPDFVRRNRLALCGYRKRLTLFGALPSFQENLVALDALRRQVAISPAACEPHFEKTYPYLDRDLLEFLYAVPREQLVRPGQRRSLVRRALRGTVPPEILNRRRKAFLSRSPMPNPAGNDAGFHPTRDATHGPLHFLDPDALFAVLKMAREGREVPLLPLKRTFLIERWLRELQRWITLDDVPLAAPDSAAARDPSSVSSHPVDTVFSRSR